MRANDASHAKALAEFNEARVDEERKQMMAQAAYEQQRVEDGAKLVIRKPISTAQAKDRTTKL